MLLWPSVQPVIRTTSSKPKQADRPTFRSFTGSTGWFKIPSPFNHLLVSVAKTPVWGGALGLCPKAPNRSDKRTSTYGATVAAGVAVCGGTGSGTGVPLGPRFFRKA